MIKIDFIKNIYEKYIQKKNLKNILIIGIGGILILLISGMFSSDKPNPQENKSEVININLIKKNAQKETEEMLKNINGVKKSKVFITYEDRGSYEYLYDEKYNLSEDKKEDQDKKVSKKREEGDEMPIIVREIAPTIKGVTAIIDGNFDKETSFEIYNAIKCSLGVEMYKIKVVINEEN